MLTQPTPTPVNDMPASATPPALARVLALQTPALTGDDILQLQKRLLALYYLAGAADGVYGRRTEAAIRLFQQVNSLPIDGVVGPQVWGVVFSTRAIAAPLVTPPAPTAAPPVAGATPTLRALWLKAPPFTGPDVFQAQRRLWELGYLGCHTTEAVLDGVFGASTEAAVERFQARQGLEINGVLSLEGWAQLLAPSAQAFTLGPVNLPIPVSLPPGKAGYLAVTLGLDIFVLDVDLGSLPWQLTSAAANTDPAWSPEGGRLAFISDRAGGPEIYVAGADGSGLTQITCSRIEKHHPAWSPDSTQLIFSGVGADGLSNLYLVNTDGAGLIALPAPSSSDAPAWSPANQIAFVSSQDGDPEIYTMNPDGSDLRQLTDNAWRDEDPAWSPDGRRLVFVSNRNGLPQLFVMNVDGSDPRPLTNLKYAPASDRPLRKPAWSPDGNRLAFTLQTGSSSNVGVVNAEGGGLIWYQLAGLAAPDWKP